MAYSYPLLYVIGYSVALLHVTSHTHAPSSYMLLLAALGVSSATSVRELRSAGVQVELAWPPQARARGPGDELSIVTALR